MLVWMGTPPPLVWVLEYLVPISWHCLGEIYEVWPYWRKTGVGLWEFKALCHFLFTLSGSRLWLRMCSLSWLLKQPCLLPSAVPPSCDGLSSLWSHTPQWTSSSLSCFGACMMCYRSNRKVTNTLSFAFNFGVLGTSTIIVKEVYFLFFRSFSFCVCVRKFIPFMFTKFSNLDLTILMCMFFNPPLIILNVGEIFVNVFFFFLSYKFGILLWFSCCL